MTLLPFFLRFAICDFRKSQTANRPFILRLVNIFFVKKNAHRMKMFFSFAA